MMRGMIEGEKGQGAGNEKGRFNCRRNRRKGRSRRGRGEREEDTKKLSD